MLRFLVNPTSGGGRARQRLPELERKAQELGGEVRVTASGSDMTAQAALAVEDGVDRLIVAGGVGANTRLRQQLGAALEKSPVSVYYPRPEFCTDNGAMVAFAGLLRLRNGAQGSLNVQARARWTLEEL